MMMTSMLTVNTKDEEFGISEGEGNEEEEVKFEDEDGNDCENSSTLRCTPCSEGEGKKRCKEWSQAAGVGEGGTPYNYTMKTRI